MDEMGMVVRKPEYLNKGLNEATKKIQALGDGIRKAYFTVAAIIAKVDREALYELDGFKNVHEWTEKEFGFKSSRSYSLLTIGQKWTDEVIDKRGHVTGHVAVIDPNFSTTQIEKMLPAGRDKAEELYEAGVIRPEMSAKDIEKAIKAALHPEEAEELETVEEQDEGANNSAPTPELCIRVTDENGTEYEIPESVLMQYKI